MDSKALFVDAQLTNTIKDVEQQVSNYKQAMKEVIKALNKGIAIFLMMVIDTKPQADYKLASLARLKKHVGAVKSSLSFVLLTVPVLSCGVLNERTLYSHRPEKVGVPLLYLLKWSNLRPNVFSEMVKFTATLLLAWLYRSSCKHKPQISDMVKNHSIHPKKSKSFAESIMWELSIH